MTDNKKLEFFRMKFESSPEVFNETQATDYIRALKESNELEEAIRVSNYFLENAPTLLNYRKIYGYMLYEMHIDVKEINEEAFFEALKTITTMCKPGAGSPYHAAVAKAIRYVTTKATPDYNQVLEVLAFENLETLSIEPFITKDGKELESKKERHYRFLVRALFETSQFDKCIEVANDALQEIKKFHYMADYWMLYYKAMAYLKTDDFESAKNLLLKIGNRLRSIDTNKLLLNAYLERGMFKEANTILIYDFFNKGYSIEMFELYKDVLEAAKRVNNESITHTVDQFLYNLALENNKEYTPIQAYSETLDSSPLYDKVYNLIMSNLALFIDRHQGSVGYYSYQGNYGIINGQCREDGIFFRQSDYIYDEEVEKRDGVEYSVMPVFDVKKQVVTERAILVYTVDQYQNFNF